MRAKTRLLYDSYPLYNQLKGNFVKSTLMDYRSRSAVLEWNTGDASMTHYAVLVVSFALFSM